MSSGTRRALTGVAALTAVSLVVFGTVVVTEARIIVGEPLPVVVAGYSFEKPDPARLALPRPGAKPAAIAFADEPAPVSLAPVDDPVALALRGPLSAAIAQAGDAGVTGIQVMDADGRIVFDLDGAQPLLPASTAKLVTAAAALTAFGPEHTFTTRATSPATLTPDGALEGDLWLLGGGDPTLISQSYVDARVDEDRPGTPIAQIADQVIAAGVTSITGSVVGDGENLEGPLLADGWPQRYLDDRDATPISGLTVDEGLEIFTTDAGALRARPAEDPAARAATVLHDALVERGVTITGPPRAAAAGEVDPLARHHVTTGVLPVLGITTSPTVQALLAHMVQQSDNHLADTMFRLVGLRVAGEGSWVDAEAQSIQVLADLQLDFSTSVLADGSGLSRADRLPAGLLTALNYRMTNSTVGVAWQDLMAVSGVSGTLRRRLTGTIAELRLRGKTGSLGDVRALSGAIVGPDSRPLFFTVLSNELDGPQLASARRLQDLVVLALTAHLYGCVELPPDPDEPLDGAGLPPLPQHSC